MTHRKRSAIRPTLQLLEHRRCLAGALGMDEFAATPAEPADQAAEVGTLTITETTVTGNTASGNGGGILNLGLKDNGPSPNVDAFFAIDSDFKGGVYVAAGDINGDCDRWLR